MTGHGLAFSHPALSTHCKSDGLVCFLPLGSAGEMDQYEPRGGAGSFWLLAVPCVMSFASLFHDGVTGKKSFGLPYCCSWSWTRKLMDDGPQMTKGWEMMPPPTGLMIFSPKLNIVRNYFVWKQRYKQRPQRYKQRPFFVQYLT